MLSKVVSHLKRRFQRKDARHSQPPELRRWSDFMNPFPQVAPGGYTKYYKTRGRSDEISPLVASPEQRTKREETPPRVSSQQRLLRKAKPTNRPVVPPIHIPLRPEQPSISVSSTSSSTLLSTTPLSLGPSISVSTTASSLLHRSSKAALLGIPEETLVESGKRRRGGFHSKDTSGGSGASLRKRKRRMLRTSAERNNVAKPFSAIAGTLSYTTSDSGARQTPLSSPSVLRNASAPTTPATLCGDVDYAIQKMPANRGARPASDKYDDGPQLDRPDSPSSFQTAKSEFSD